MAELRVNRAKSKLQEGKPIIGVGQVNDGDMIELLGSVGTVDLINFDMEHGPTSWAQLRDVSRICDLWGMTPQVRVNNNDPWLIGRALDQGALSVMIPHVNTMEDAERAVRGAKYAPLGLRGMGRPRQGLGVSNYYTKANDQTMVVAMIEDIEAVKNLKEILTVDHIDVFLVAPNDLSQSMGAKYLPGQYGTQQNQDVQRVVDGAIKQIVAAGRVAATLVNDGNVEHFLDLGVRFLNMGDPSGYIASGLKGFHDKVVAKMTPTATRSPGAR